VVFLGAALTLYGPALSGPFLSDDFHYVAQNSYIQQLSPASLVGLFDPVGAATIDIVNYAPVQLLVHAFAWQAFGPETLGHHTLNVVLHALASALLVALFLASGIPRPGALLGGALFLLHPANVEAVAWISQLKSTLALTLALGALLAHRRRPALATLLFAAALLAKPTAVFALPVAALLDWSRDGRVRWGWLAGWAALFGVYALVEFATHQRSGAAEARLYETPLVLVRTVAAIGSRYLVMASTSWGLSAFHEPRPAFSPFDPWWLLALPMGALLVWRMVVVARRRDAELAWWVWAAVSFAPISQIFPFLYPMADRYLYFILPGLIGGTLLAAREGLERLPGALAGRGPQIERAALIAGIVLAAFFAARSYERAALWRQNAVLLADAAAHYPNGVVANVVRAKRAAYAGDTQTVFESLRRAAERGFNRFQQLEADPAYAAVRDHPEFRAIVRGMADHWIEAGRRKANPTQTELRLIAHAHIARGEVDQALRLLERAVEVGGPRSAAIRQEAALLRAAIEAEAPERVRLGVNGAS
jgi:hypothetical protein